mmetsp:Transcript_8238/g.24721  ORF Transcript_8238/g.24721 Transcript_8238/m.24721 type:complete len:127 (-) Transcript_8238:200-580(-)
MSPVSASAMRGFGVRKAGLGASVRARTACAASTSNRVLEQSSKQLPTVEQQRVAARQMIAYFKEKKVEAEYEKNKQLGWVPKAEIANGRWVMFGLLVGMLTEYSTGVNFIEQIKLLLVNLSIVDFD